MATDPLVVAARYWRRQLGGFFLFDNGEHTDDSRFAEGMASMLRARIAPLITPGVLDAFEAALLRRVREKVAERDDYVICTLGTDYGPCPVLHDALVEAGLPEWVASSSGVLPWKTTLFVRGDRVSVREGYGAPDRDLTE